MKFLKYKTKNFRKIKILSNYKKSRRRKYLETVIEIDHKIIIVFKIIFLIFFIYFDITLFTKIKIKPITKVSQTIFNEMKSYEDMHKNISLEEVQEFRQYSRDKKFIEDSPNFQKSENPIITVIITMHNQAHILHKSIKSVQNQSIKNIEILIIDDCSRDNTTETIAEYQKEDPRIVLVEHDMNGGSIKSRADGVRLAKGKYITIVDGDDALAHKDILKDSLYLAEKGDLDVVEFQAGSFKNSKFITIVNAYSMINLTNIVYQPELRTKFFVISDNEGVRAVQSRCIYAKLIKNEVFKEAVKYIGTKYTEDFIIQYEDAIMAVAIHQVSNSYYYLKELGYYYARGQGGAFPKLKNKVCKSNPARIKDMGHMKLLHFLFEKFGKNEFEKQMIYHEIISIHHYLSLVYWTNHHYDYVYEILDPMINCPYLSNRQKQRLLDIRTRIENKQHKK